MSISTMQWISDNIDVLLHEAGATFDAGMVGQALPKFEAAAARLVKIGRCDEGRLVNARMWIIVCNERLQEVRRVELIFL